MRGLAAALAFAATVAFAQGVPSLPAALLTDVPALKPLGDGRLRWFGLHVYDSSLWVAAAPWSFDRLFALDIRYAMNIKGRELSVTSIKEMKGLGFTDPEKLRRWETAMDRVFPDIKPGDRLVGVHVPGREARFYSNEKLLGSVNDPEFSRAFFGIWLDARTSAPELRSALLQRPAA